MDYVLRDAILEALLLWSTALMLFTGTPWPKTVQARINTLMSSQWENTEMGESISESAPWQVIVAWALVGVTLRSLWL